MVRLGAITNKAGGGYARGDPLEYEGVGHPVDCGGHVGGDRLVGVTTFALRHMSGTSEKVPQARSPQCPA